MSSTTPTLGLYKADPVVDASSNFSVTTMLNNNWDALDAAVKPLSTDTPLMNGDASAGLASASSKADHVHPTDTTRAAKQPTLATWIAPTLLNGWVNFGGTTSTAGYFKDDFGFVHIRGFIKNGTSTQGTVFFTLPAGYRPLVDSNPVTVSNNGSDVISRVGISNTGNVTIQSGVNAFFSLDIAPFRAEQ